MFVSTRPLFIVLLTIVLAVTTVLLRTDYHRPRPAVLPPLKWRVTELPVNNSRAELVCYPSPYVDCSRCRRPCIVKNIYSLRLKMQPDYDALSDGVTAYRVARRNTSRERGGVEPVAVVGDHLEHLRTHSLEHSRSARQFRVSWKLLGARSFSMCRFDNCVSVRGDSGGEGGHGPGVDAVVVNVVMLDLKSPLPERPQDQIYVLAGRETPAYYNPRLADSAWNHAFNLTAHWRLDADIFDPYAELEYVNRRFTDIADTAARKTKTAVWIVSNCNTPSRRMEYVREMQKYISVDIYGGCGAPCKGKGRREGLGFDCLEGLGEEYRFFLAFENSYCEDYVTEKFFHSFRGRRTVIPVVRGAVDYDSLFPPGSFVNAAHFDGPKSLALHLKRLGENLNDYVELLMTKLQYTVKKEIPLQCGLCEYLNKRDHSEKRMYDLHRWLIQDRCTRPTDNGISNSNSYIHIPAINDYS